MKRASLLPLLLIAGMLPLLSGCGKSADSGKNADKAGQPTKPLGPAESMQALIDGVGNKKMDAAWNFLPASYQTEVNGLVKEFAGKMDPEMYHGSFQAAQRITKLLKDKKGYILENETITGLNIPPEQLDQFWGPTVTVLDSIVQSDLSNLDKLKNFDGGKFLSTTGNQLAENVMVISNLIPAKEGEASMSDKMKQAKVTTVSTEGDTAKVKIEVPGEEPKEVEMVKVEDKWIPKNLADNWKSKMDELQKQIASLTPEKVTAQKEQTLAGLKKINEVLAQLEKAENSKEFNATLNPYVAPLAMLGPMMMMQMMGQQPGMRGPQSLGGPQIPGKTTPARGMATIVFSRKLTFEEQDPIIKEVGPIAKSAGAKRVLPSTVNKTTILRISPMGDMKKFVDELKQKIKFGKVTKVDLETNTIDIEVNK